MRLTSAPAHLSMSVQSTLSVMLKSCSVSAGDMSQRQLRYIEWKGVKIYDFQKVTFSTHFKLNIGMLGVQIPKRYHMWW